MTVAFNINGLGFASITVGVTTTVLPLMGISYSPNVVKEPFRSGGDINPSMMRRAGGRPAFRLTMPLDIAWTAVGSFLPAAVSAFTMYEASFTGTPLLRIGTSATTLALTASTGGAYALITRIYPTGGAVPLMMAEVTIVFCATDGLTDPVTVSTGSIPSLSSNPTLHTLGPMVDNATTRWGVQTWSLDTGVSLEPIQRDGFFYPTTYRVGAVQATATITHDDVVALYAALGDNGKDGTGAGFILWARAYDAASKTLQATGYSFTMAKGLASLENIAMSGTERAETALIISSYAAPNALTYPITVATSGTLPT